MGKSKLGTRNLKPHSVLITFWFMLWLINYFFSYIFYKEWNCSITKMSCHENTYDFTPHIHTHNTIGSTMLEHLKYCKYAGYVLFFFLSTFLLCLHARYFLRAPHCMTFVRWIEREIIWLFRYGSYSNRRWAEVGGNEF